MKQISLAFLILICFACNSQTNEITEESNFESRSADLKNVLKSFETISKDIENVYKKDTLRLELYLQEESDGIIKRVPNFNDVPESFNSSFNVIRNKSGNIIFIGEYPYSESGDWNLAYESYFDENGDLVAFIRMSDFFNGGCAEIVHEKSEYYYDSSHKLIKKTYDIKDGDDKPLDFTKCDFYYRNEYEKFMTLNDFLKKYKFSK